MMNRASLDVHKSRNVDEEANAKHKYQTLANEFLELQKEIVSKKRKLKAAKTKWGKIFAEVRFLRQRHKCLTQIEDSNKEKDLLHLQNADGEINLIEGERNGNAYEAVAQNSDSTLFSNSHTDSVEDRGQNPIIKKPRKNGLVSNKAATGKRKISQHDPFALHV